MKIYTDVSTSVDITVSEGNKWYSYLIPKDKGLYRLGERRSLCPIEKVNVKADIIIDGGDTIINCESVVEASFKGSNTSKLTIMNSIFASCINLTSLDLSGWDTSNVEDMDGMFGNCQNLASLDLSGWDTSKVTDMSQMFGGCTSLKTIKMVGCEKPTIDKIKAQLKADGLSENIVKQ